MAKMFEDARRTGATGESQDGGGADPEEGGRRLDGFHRPPASTTGSRFLEAELNRGSPWAGARRAALYRNMMQVQASLVETLTQGDEIHEIKEEGREEEDDHHSL